MVASANSSLLVIPSINGGTLLERMLPTIRFPAERVVVLDQGSTDSTADVCVRAGVELVQLGRPHTYTEACNIGATIARERGVPYLCVSNNDIVFRTDVMDEMAAALDADPRLAIVAPAQIIIDDALDEQPLAYRVLWSLERVAFFHDLDGVHAASERLEADFCELTCALIRMAAVAKVGFLDDAYGFYHEDADFGFRLRQAGWNCAYLPRSQIEHYSSSTFSREKAARKADYIARNKLRFAEKLLGYGLSFAVPARPPADVTQPAAADLHRYLERYGLLDEAAPKLLVGYPDMPAADYLYTPFESRELPPAWRRNAGAAAAVFTTSAAARDAVLAAGAAHSAVVPPGVEPDVFHPWRAVPARDEALTYLAVVDGQQRRSLAAILSAWTRFAAGGRRVRLRLLGRDLADCLGRAPDVSYRDALFDTARFRPERIDVHEARSGLRREDLADLYRSVDYVIYASCGEGTMASVLQAQACGIPCLFGHDGATADLAFPDALTFASAPGGEPDGSTLGALLERSFALSAPDRAIIARRGVYDVRGRFTLRHSAMGFHRALAGLQRRDPGKLIEDLKLRPAGKEAIGTPARGAASTVMSRVSGLTARRVQTLGRLAMELGAAWEQRGLLDASRSTTAELRLFLRHRSRQVSRLSGGMARKLASKRLASQRRPSGSQDEAVLFVAYVEGQLGLGQSSRDLALAMAAAAVPFRIHPVSLGIENRLSGPYMSERYDTRRSYGINLLYLTPDELPNVVADIGHGRFARGYNILRTYWELSEAPAIWADKLDMIDELWVPNRFVAESFRGIFDGPVTVIPPCVTMPAWDAVGRDRFGLDADRFYFLFSFDYFSFPNRKNPLAVVRAFRKAFPDQADRVGLIVKSSGAAEHYPEIKEVLRAAARYDGRIAIIDEHLSRAELLSLMKAADCYVSMHRAEGFGLGMAEAMAMEKPVIGTDYSGNTDFLNQDTGYPLPYSLTKLGPRDYVNYVKGQVWAEPSEAACADAMVRVVGNRAEAAAKARAGRLFVEARYAPANVGAAVAERLRAIRDAHRKGAEDPA